MKTKVVILRFYAHYRFHLTEYGKAMAEKFGFTDDIDENGCVIAKVYYQLLRKTSRKGRLVNVFFYKIKQPCPQGLSSSCPVPSRSSLASRD